MSKINYHIIKETEYLSEVDFEEYNKGDLIIILEPPIQVYRLIGSGKRKFLDNITNSDHRLLLQSSSYEEIIKRITEFRNTSSMDLALYNKNISITENELKTLELLKEMI